jgi:hypothetical protein
MYDVLDLYQESYDPERPVVGVDEKPKQLIREKRRAIPMRPGRVVRQDYEYVRSGSANIFVAVDHKEGRRDVQVTDRRTRRDFALYVKHLVEEVFPGAAVVRMVMDNLNTHNQASFYRTFGHKEAERLLNKTEFHYTPVHGSWLNVAEVEIGVMDTECTGRRIGDKQTLTRELEAWTEKRNRDRKKIDWRFTRQDADTKLSKHYVP